MQFLPIIAILSLAAGSHAWAKDGATGQWVANNRWYTIQGSIRVHEACTKMNTEEWYPSGKCAYWTDSHGGKKFGHCMGYGNPNTYDCR